MHITKNKTTRVLFNPLIRFCEWMGEHFPVLLIKMRYFARFRKLPNLKNPQDLNEKILFLKLFSDTTEWVRLADKYRVRDYVKECGLEDILIPLIGVWKKVEDVDFDSLPNSLIFKANNGCWPGSTLVINDMSKANREELKKIFQSWLDQKHIGDLSAEPHYKHIKPCIIAEQLLPIEEGHNSLVDYKVWCFNGTAYYIMTCSSRDDSQTKLNLFDLDWNLVSYYLNPSNSHPVETKELPKPLCLKEMIKAAEVLANGFPCVRVDLYNVGGKVFFGEMTFTSLGGMMEYYTTEFLQKCGDIIDLRNVKMKQ